MDNALRFPWGGDVVQSINPWDLWIKTVSSQLGFINVKNVMSSDSRIEQEIVEDVASYGRQLGQIADVIKVLLKQHAAEDLKPEEKQTVARFSKMALEIDRVKRKWKTPEKLLAELDTILAQIRELKADSPDLFEIVVTKIKNELQILDTESRIRVESVPAKTPSSKRGTASGRSSSRPVPDISSSTGKATIVLSQGKIEDLG